MHFSLKNLVSYSSSKYNLYVFKIKAYYYLSEFELILKHVTRDRIN